VWRINELAQQPQANRAARLVVECVDPRPKLVGDLAGGGGIARQAEQCVVSGDGRWDHQLTDVAQMLSMTAAAATHHQLRRFDLTQCDAEHPTPAFDVKSLVQALVPTVMTLRSKRLAFHDPLVDPPDPWVAKLLHRTKLRK
jgi:hypothetical protein